MSENIISKKDHMNYTFAAGLSEPEGCVPPDQLTPQFANRKTIGQITILN